MRVWNVAYMCSCINQFVFMHNPYSSSISNSLTTVLFVVVSSDLLMNLFC